jgi:hypothetical protein
MILIVFGMARTYGAMDGGQDTRSSCSPLATHALCRTHARMGSLHFFELAHLNCTALWTPFLCGLLNSDDVARL